MAQSEAQLANLKPGGTLGNKGGTGRPPNELRYRSRELFEKFLEKAATKVDDNLSAGEVGKLIDVTGKYGLGEKQWDLSESAQVEAIGTFTAQFFKEQGTPELFEQWVAGCKKYFKGL